MFMSFVKKIVYRLFNTITYSIADNLSRDINVEKMLLGRLLANQVAGMGNVIDLQSVEFRVFSQWGDDGIIQYLISSLKIENHTFVEFGVGKYQEANTRFLLENNNWSGLIIDGSAENIKMITNSNIYWRHNLRAVSAFVTRENINNLISDSNYRGEVGILHIDIDGNDYWVWEAIDVIVPVIAIIEYNSVFGNEREISIPYDEAFVRSQAHHSNLYFGASLPAICYLAKLKGYAFVGCNSNGNNAYFVRKDKLCRMKEIDRDKGYVFSKFSESRDEEGKLNYLRGKNRLEAIKGLPVINVRTGQRENL